MTATHTVTETRPNGTTKTVVIRGLANAIANARMRVAQGADEATVYSLDTGRAVKTYRNWAA